MSLKDKYKVEGIDNKQTYEWFLYKHYAKRIPSISFAFGLIKDNIVVGVVSFGKPPMALQRTGICGKEYGHLVYELNRLIISEGLDENILSFFVSKALKLLPKPLIVISYADKDFGHNGFIYQATNFLFVGETQKHNHDITIDGSEGKHQSTITDKFRGVENRMDAIRKEYGDRLKTVKRTQKNRYLYFLGSKQQIKKMKSELKYKILPYPKMDNKRYDASYNPKVQIGLF